jgi:hypothetical protein
MLDDILGSVVKTVLHHVFETMLKLVFYWPGWLILRAITLNKYPPSQIEKHNRIGVALFGCVAILLAVAIYTVCKDKGIA